MHKTRQRQKLSSILKNNLTVLSKVAKYTPDYFVLMFIEGIVWGMLNASFSLFNYHLLNTVDGGSFHRALMWIGLMALFYLLVYAFDRWYWTVKNHLLRKKLHLRMHEEMYLKARSLDLACFDDPEFYNDFVWAMNESDTRAVEVVENTGKLINRVIAASTMFGLLFTVDPVIALILFLSTWVTVVCNLLGNRVSFAQSKEQNPLGRKKSYVNRVYHLADYAKELRIHHADELLMREYDRTTEEMIRVDRKYGMKYFLLYGVGWEGIGQVTFFAIILYMIGLFSKGALAVGSFAATVSVMWGVRWQLTDLIERLTSYAKHSLYIEKYLEFLRFEPKIKEGCTEIPAFRTLELRNVSFSYEFSAHPKYRFHEEDYEAPKGERGGKDAIKQVSLTLRAGEKIALVGYNGAGKTTLIKLIMRMYDPTEGEILYNGIDIRSFEPEAYRAKIGTVFQDFKIFATSIAENTMNGPCREEEREIAERALRTVDFGEKLDSLEAGLDTHLTREFDTSGTNLSGGEAQKVAISRVFARDYPIVIMDEPSAALDPMAEYQLNQSILHSTEDKTVIFISHRLSTTRIADRIYMFDGGALVEEGSHEQLLEMHGKYAEMFRVQAEKYRL